MPENGDRIGAPRDREKCLSAALFRLTGCTQAEAASVAGVTASTVLRWESCSWWPDVLAEASDRWLAGLTAKARRGLEAGVAKDGNLALKVLERLEPKLAPPRLHVGLSADLSYEDMTDEQLKRIAAGEPPLAVRAGG